MISLKNKQGWVTVACAFVLQGLTHGLGSSMGVFYVAWRDAFPSSSTLISALATSVLATILCTAPVAGAVSKKAGIRLAMAFGGALSFCGFCLTSFVQKASLLFLTVSVMIGIGSSIVYMSSVIAVSNHFRKNFVTASAIANAGASAGVLILPLLFEVLVSTYDWRGACFIVAAIQLHVFVMMMIIKAPKAKKRKVIVKTVAPSQSAAGTAHGVNESSKNADPNSVKLGEDDQVREDAKFTELQDSSPVRVNPDSQEFEENDRVKVGSDVNEKTMNFCIKRGNRTDGIIGESLKETEGNVEKMDPLCEDPMEMEESLQPTELSQETDYKEKNCIQFLSYRRILNHFYSLVDLFNVPLIWRNLPFSTLLISFFLGGWFLGTVLPHLSSRAGDVDIDTLLASSLISVYGAGNLVSRMFYGRLVDSGLIHPIILFLLAYFITTVAAAVIAFAEIYLLLIVGAFGIGIGSGIYIPLMQPIVRCLSGPKDFGGAFGLCLLSVGIGNFLSAICAGQILDATGNYTYVFLLPTSTGVLCCCTIVFNHLFWGIYRHHPDWPKRAVRKQVAKKDAKSQTYEA